MSATGTAILDFGLTPGTNNATVVITGQTAILSNSYAEAFMMGEATATHNAYEHLIVPIKLMCYNIAPGVGFTIHATTEWRLDGTFNVRWVWT